MRRYTEKAAAWGAVITVIAIFTGFQFFPDEQTMLTRLLDERTQILQNAYYGRMSRDVAKTLLPKIESFPLLAEDEQALAENTDGDMDIINHMYLMEYEPIDKGKGGTSYRIEILWDMQGITDNYYQKCTYFIQTVIINGEMKLSEMTLIES